MAHRFPIGTQYVSRHGKITRTCIVIDQLTTRNSAGAIVRECYVTTHEFCGQRIAEHDVCDTTIARGIPGFLSTAKV